MYDAEVNFPTSWRGHLAVLLVLYPNIPQRNYPELMQEISLALKLARGFGE